MPRPDARRDVTTVVGTRPELLYDAGWQAKKVRGLVAFAAFCTAGAGYAAADIAATFGLSPADGGALRPLAERVAFAGLVASIGAGFLAAMLVYARCSVARVEAGAPDEVVLVPLWGAPLRVRERDVLRSRWHEGRSGRVNAPWTSVRVRGRRLPMIIDGQGTWTTAPPRWLG